jgi:alpha-mannosidase
MDCVCEKPRTGDLPGSQSFLSVTPSNVQLSAFRARRGGGFELRVVETDGSSAQGTIAVQLPVQQATETDLVGNRLADAKPQGMPMLIMTEPWKIRTFRLQ